MKSKGVTRGEIVFDLKKSIYVKKALETEITWKREEERDRSNLQRRRAGSEEKRERFRSEERQ